MTATARPDAALEWAQAWMADHPHATTHDLWVAVEVVYGEADADRVTPAVWRRVTPVALGTVPQIRSVDTPDGVRHYDDTGREYRAVEVDGELTYQAATDPHDDTTDTGEDE